MATIHSSQSQSLCSIGSGNIDQEVVNSAVFSIQQTSLKILSKIVDEKMGPINFEFQTFECLTKRGVSWGRIKCKNVCDGRETRYAISLHVNIEDIDNSTPAGLLVSELSKKVAQLGFSGGIVDLRFEQGCLDSLTPYWHFDPKPNYINSYQPVYSINTSYSNKKNWNTRILNQKHDSRNANNRIEQIEQLSKPAKFGFLYDGQRILHRSPVEKDLEGGLANTDYRLFIRFFKWPEKNATSQ